MGNQLQFQELGYGKGQQHPIEGFPGLGVRAQARNRHGRIQAGTKTSKQAQTHGGFVAAEINAQHIRPDGDGNTGVNQQFPVHGPNKETHRNRPQEQTQQIRRGDTVDLHLGEAQ